MMRRYPKLPTGPSSLGAASVRALDANGGDFQVSFRDASTVARVAGEFSRVTTGGFEYVTEGRIRATPNERRPFITPNYRIVFLPGFGRPGTVFVGAGTYYATNLDSRSTSSQAYIYPVDGTARSAPYQNLRSLSAASGVFLTVYGARNFRGAIDFGYDSFTYPPGVYQPVEALFASSSYLVHVTEPQEQRDRLVLSPFVVPGDERVDVAGRALPDLALVVWRQANPPIGTRLFVGRDDVEFLPFIPPVTTDNFGAFLVMERFFWCEAFLGGKDYRPRMRLFVLNDKSPELISTFDVTALMFADIYVPEPNPGNPLVPGLEADYYAPDVPEVRFVNAINTDMMALMRVCAIEGNRFLVAYTAMISDPGWSAEDYRFHYRIARVDLQALTLETLLDEALDVLPGSSSGTRKHIEVMLHLGGDFVLAKEIAGWKGINHEVTFLLSSDGGTSWEVLSPSGLESPLLNQYLGKFTLHRARQDGPPPVAPVVLMPAWSEVEEAYHVFESSDYGATWHRRARIARPDAFYRVDSMLAGDGGANFDLLLPGTDLMRAPDLAAPERFNQ